MHLVELLLATGVLIACGVALIGPSVRALGAGSPALAAAVGAALLTPVLVAASAAGARIGTASLLLAAGSAGLAAHWLRRRSSGRSLAPVRAHDRSDDPGEPGWLRLIAFAALSLLLAAFVAKVWTMPLWSWDHYAIWGIKLERAIPEGRLDLDALRSLQLKGARPDYPLGLAALWRVLLPGAEITAQDLKAVHLLFGLGLAALTYAALRRVGQTQAAAGALAAAAVAGPLYWDTVAVGLAEMPLAFFSMAAMAALLAAEDRGHPALLFAAGVAAGFLPWVKDEGLPLAFLVAGYGALRLRRLADAHGEGLPRRFAAFLVPVGIGLAGRGVVAAALPEGASLFQGAILERCLERLGRAPELLAAAAKPLLLPDFLGLWSIFALCLLVALVRGGRARPLALVVGLQLAAYVAVMFLTFLPPESQIDAALPRIAAALGPLAIVAIGAVLTGRRPGVARSLPHESHPETATISR